MSQATHVSTVPCFFSFFLCARVRVRVRVWVWVRVRVRARVNVRVRVGVGLRVTCAAFSRSSGVGTKRALSAARAWSVFSLVAAAAATDCRRRFSAGPG